MREHRIVSWCDVHQHQSPDAPVEASHTIVLSVSEGSTVTNKYRRIDVCADCLLQLAGLVEVVDEFGVAPDEAPRNVEAPRKAHAKGAASMQPDPGTCTICGAEYQWLATHYGNNHGLTTKACETDGQFVCPSCGESFASANGLTRHVAADHDTRVPYLLAEIQTGKPRRKRAAS
jgi:C2H2-type zinc finger